MAKFKVGDKVRILDGSRISDYYDVHDNVIGFVWERQDGKLVQEWR